MKTIQDMQNVLRERGLLIGIAQGVKMEKMAGQEIRWLTCDSRAVREHTAFICKGASFRAEYLQDAVKHGAICYISEKPMEVSAVGLIVTDIRRAMAVASAYFFSYTSDRPIVTGITGTKGKTTTAWYLKAMLDAWVQEKGDPETGLISTVENYDGTSRCDSVMTTPEAPTLHELLSNAANAGVSYMTMEVSSQALKYRRVQELRFSVGIFLNISEDHISPGEHTDFEDYFSAKLSMFRQMETACVNLDSDYAQRILKAAYKAKRVVTFGKNRDADLRCSEIQTKGGAVSFRVTCDRFSEYFTLGMRGTFNIENAMAAIAAAYVYGVPVHCMKQALLKTRVPGRMENFFSADGRICGIVDFAHNRLSFEKLFDAAFEEYSAYRRIITVFGCPGGKALNRRRELGIIAGLFSDSVILTSDDPGMERPEQIAEEIRGYVEMTGCTCRIVADRKEAVEAAVSVAAKAQEKTLILLLGRGSEKFQQVEGRLLASETDAQLMEAAIRTYDSSTLSV